MALIFFQPYPQAPSHKKMFYEHYSQYKKLNQKISQIKNQIGSNDFDEKEILSQKVILRDLEAGLEKESEKISQIVGGMYPPKLVEELCLSGSIAKLELFFHHLPSDHIHYLMLDKGLQQSLQLLIANSKVNTPLFLKLWEHLEPKDQKELLFETQWIPPCSLITNFTAILLQLNNPATAETIFKTLNHGIKFQLAQETNVLAHLCLEGSPDILEWFLKQFSYEETVELASIQARLGKLTMARSAELGFSKEEIRNWQDERANIERSNAMQLSCKRKETRCFEILLAHFRKEDLSSLARALDHKKGTCFTYTRQNPNRQFYALFLSSFDKDDIGKMITNEFVYHNGRYFLSLFQEEFSLSDFKQIIDFIKHRLGDIIKLRLSCKGLCRDVDKFGYIWNNLDTESKNLFFEPSRLSEIVNAEDFAPLLVISSLLQPLTQRLPQSEGLNPLYYLRVGNPLFIQTADQILDINYSMPPGFLSKLALWHLNPENLKSYRDDPAYQRVIHKTSFFSEEIAPAEVLVALINTPGYRRFLPHLLKNWDSEITPKEELVWQPMDSRKSITINYFSADFSWHITATEVKLYSQSKKYLGFAIKALIDDEDFTTIQASLELLTEREIYELAYYHFHMMLSLAVHPKMQSLKERLLTKLLQMSVSEDQFSKKLQEYTKEHPDFLETVPKNALEE